MSIGPTKITYREAKEKTDRLEREAASTLDPARRRNLLSLASYNRRLASQLSQPH